MINANGISTVNLDAGSDSAAAARNELFAAVQRVNQLTTHLRGDWQQRSASAGVLDLSQSTSQLVDVVTAGVITSLGPVQQGSYILRLSANNTFDLAGDPYQFAQNDLVLASAEASSWRLYLLSSVAPSQYPNFFINSDFSIDQRKQGNVFDLANQGPIRDMVWGLCQQNGLGYTVNAEVVDGQRFRFYKSAGSGQGAAIQRFGLAYALSSEQTKLMRSASGTRFGVRVQSSSPNARFRAFILSWNGAADAVGTLFNATTWPLMAGAASSLFTGSFSTISDSGVMTANGNKWIDISIGYSSGVGVVQNHVFVVVSVDPVAEAFFSRPVITAGPRLMDWSLPAREAELQRCLPYYQRIEGPRMVGLMTTPTSISRLGAAISPPMIKAPVLNLSGTLNVWDGGNAAAFTTKASTYTNKNQYDFDVTDFTSQPGAFTPGRPALVYCNGGVNPAITLDASLFA